MKTIAATQILEHADNDDAAANIAMAYMGLDGFLGGRVRGGKWTETDRETGRPVAREGWTVQVFFRPGTAIGKDVLVPQSLASALGF